MGDLYHAPSKSSLLGKAPFSNCRGFTLLEVILALSLAGILTAIFGMGLVAAVQSYDFSRTNAHMAQKAQMAMTRMSRELMELTNITTVIDDPFIIYERLVEGNPPSVQQFGIRHHPEDDTIRLYTGDQGDTLIDGVEVLTLAYWKGSQEWTFVESPNNTQELSHIELTMILSRPDRPDEPQAFETTIHLRNNNNFGGAAPTTSPESREDYTCFIGTLMGGPSL